MSNLEFGVQYPYDGAVWGNTPDRDEIIRELLWALDMREQLEAKGYVSDVKMFMNPKIVVRDLEDADPVAWAPLDISAEEIRDAAREFYGEID